jgi:hypothetical protein
MEMGVVLLGGGKVYLGQVICMGSAGEVHAWALTMR